MAVERPAPANDEGKRPGVQGRTTGGSPLIEREVPERSRVAPAPSPAPGLGERQPAGRHRRPERLQLRSPFPIGQGSLWKSLLHLDAAEYVWLEALLGHDDALVPGDLPGQLPGNQQGQGGITGPDDLRQKWSALEQRWAGYLVTLTSESLGELVSRKSTSSGLGKRFGPRRGDVL